MFSVSVFPPPSSSSSALIVLHRANDKGMQIKVSLARRGTYLRGGEDWVGESAFCWEDSPWESFFSSPSVWNQHDTV